MTDYNQILLSILLVLTCVLVVFLIVAAVKLIITTDKVNIILEDLQQKLKSVNGFFNCLDSITDAVSLVGDVLIDRAIGIVDRLIAKKRKRKDEENE